MRIFIDIDDTICQAPEDCSLSDKYTLAEPMKDKIQMANELYDEGHYIVYWTGRGGKSGIDWYEHTEEQLEKWGCKYHELRCGIKKDWDIIIDNRAFNSYKWTDNEKVKDILKKNI